MSAPNLWGVCLTFPGRLRVHSCPKAASDSITKATHHLMHLYRKDRVDVAGPEYRWMVVRHPLDRMVSAWAFFCVNENLRNQPRLREIGYRHSMDFGEFLGIALQRHAENQHTGPQAVYAGPHEFDRLGRLENLSAEWAALQARFPVLDRGIGHSNRSQRGDWRGYYDRRTQARAEQAFAADMALYERADPNPPKE